MVWIINRASRRVRVFLHVSYLSGKNYGCTARLYLEVQLVGSLHAWFRHRYGLEKVPESFLTVVPKGLVRPPDPHPLQVHTERVRFGWEHFPISMRRFLPHGDIGTMNSGGILLACAEVFTSRKRNYSTPLKGTKLGCGAYVMQMHVSGCEGIYKPLPTSIMIQSIKRHQHYWNANKDDK